MRTVHAGTLECLDFLESQNGAAVRPRQAPTIDDTSKVAQSDNVLNGDTQNSATIDKCEIARSDRDTVILTTSLLALFSAAVMNYYHTTLECNQSQARTSPARKRGTRAAPQS